MKIKVKGGQKVENILIMLRKMYIRLRLVAKCTNIYLLDTFELFNVTCCNIAIVKFSSALTVEHQNVKMIYANYLFRYVV